MDASAIQTDIYDYNVSQNWEKWFLWGFFIYVFLALQQLAQMIGDCNNDVFWKNLAYWFGMPVGLGSFAWIIWGAVARWSWAGNACSGSLILQDQQQRAIFSTSEDWVYYGEPPYQWKTGDFMYYYLMCIIGILILVGACVGCLVCAAVMS